MTPSSPEPSQTFTPVDLLSFEQAQAELESIVAALESGDHALDVALSLYERGQALSRRCVTLLDQAELKVQSLSGETLDDLGQV